MAAPIIRKLENFAKLSSRDRIALEELSSQRRRQVGSREDIIREGERPEVLNLVNGGWACRYKHLADGRRQILSFFLPGDLCDLNIFILREMDHSIGAITQVTVAQITPEIFDRVTLNHPRLLQALWWDSLVTSAIQREWTLSVGQRDALERVAHLLCELFVRLRAVGMVEDGSCELPVTQADLADATGLSSVHVNRTLQDLRSSNLISLKGRTLRISDLDALMTTAMFNPNYLHLEREGRHLDANE